MYDVSLEIKRKSLVNPRDAREAKGDGDGDGEGFVSPFIFVTAAVESAQFYYKSILASDTKSARVTRRWRDGKLYRKLYLKNRDVSLRDRTKGK